MPGERQLPPALLAAYRRTAYQIPGGVVRIGRRSTAADRLLAELGCREAVLITAWNPFSRRRPPGWNRRMQDRLRAALRRFPVLPAGGGTRQWWEEHLLVPMPPGRAAVLARVFRQNAIVIIHRAQPARLQST